MSGLKNKEYLTFLQKLISLYKALEAYKQSRLMRERTTSVLELSETNEFKQLLSAFDLDNSSTNTDKTNHLIETLLKGDLTSQITYLTHLYDQELKKQGMELITDEELPPSIGLLVKKHNGVLFAQHDVEILESLEKVITSTLPMISLNKIGPIENFFGYSVKRYRVVTLGLLGKKLTTFPERICDLTHLEILNLTYTALKSLPPNIDNLVNLRKLYLIENKLIELPTSIGRLVNLEVLCIDSNNLLSLPESIGNLKNLKRLDLTYNEHLQTLPRSILQLTKLKELYMAGCWSEEMPETVFEIIMELKKQKCFVHI